MIPAIRASNVRSVECWRLVVGRRDGNVRERALYNRGEPAALTHRQSDAGELLLLAQQIGKRAELGAWRSLDAGCDFFWRAIF